MTMLSTKIKYFVSLLPLFSLVAQQLCLCLLLCNLIHSHIAGSTTSLYSSGMIEQKIVTQNDIPCNEGKHIETCAKERILLSNVNSDFIVPEKSQTPEIISSFHQEISCSVIENPYFRDKIFLKLHAFLC